MLLLACLGAAAGVALCWPVPREAACGNHCSIYQSFKQPPPDPQLHKSGHGNQGDAIDSYSMTLLQRFTSDACRLYCENKCASVCSRP